MLSTMKDATSMGADILERSPFIMQFSLEDSAISYSVSGDVFKILQTNVIVVMSNKNI